MIRRMLLLKFVSWCVLAPVLALARHSICASASRPIFRIPCESGRFEGRFLSESGDIFASHTTA